MSLEKIYVIGDSYCAQRTDPHGHWPLILANKIGVELLGDGLAGCTWWDVRSCLLKFAATPEFDQIELFVMCHTEHNRIIGKKPHHHIIDDKNLEVFRRHYFDVIYDEEFNTWCMKNWLLELNKIFQNKKVIHLAGFENLLPYMDLLDGIKVRPSLTEISLLELGAEDTKLLNYDNGRANHFSQENNQWLAEQLYKIYTTGVNQDYILPRGTHG